MPKGVYKRRDLPILPPVREPFTRKRVTVMFDGRPIRLGFRDWPHATVEFVPTNKKPVEIHDAAGSTMKLLGTDRSRYCADDFYFDLPGSPPDYSVNGATGENAVITYLKTS